MPLTHLLDDTDRPTAPGNLGRWMVACGWLWALAACSVAPRGPDASKAPHASTRRGTPTEAPALASPGPAYAPGLAGEQRWLDAWFRGTPAVIAQNDDGELIVEVPRAYSFERGHSQMRPALAAVMDKVAQSLRRTPAARLVVLSAPDDKTGATPLALQRAIQLHKRLLERGVTAAQLSPPTATPGAAVQLRIGLATAP